jgi:hypothetical protein
MANYKKNGGGDQPREVAVESLNNHILSHKEILGT